MSVNIFLRNSPFIDVAMHDIFVIHVLHAIDAIFLYQFVIGVLPRMYIPLRGCVTNL